ncbi:MAG: ATP-binding protein [Halobacteriota archaeon]|nr:ATP-binding protein [Halobacteriota archaeon]
MAREIVGIIFGETSPFEFKFAVSDVETKRSDYVKVSHNSRWVLAQVVAITISSDVLSLDAAISAASGKRIGDTEEKIVAKAIVIGSKDKNGLLRTPKTPFSPGDKVYKADHSLIKKTLGLASGDAYIGLLEGSDIQVRIDVNKLVQHHCSILAKTGSGKSYTAGVIIEELIEKGVPLLIIDPHGEYTSLKGVNRNKDDNILMERFGLLPRGYDSVITFTPSNLTLNQVADEVFRLDGVNLSAKMLSQLMPSLTNTQIGVLYRSVRRVMAHNEFYTIEDILAEVSGDNSNAKWNVIDALESLRDMGIFSDSPTVIDDLMQKGKTSIIDMRGVDPDLKDIVVSMICGELWEARKIGRVPPGMLIIEESHEFCPEKGYGKTASSNIIRTIASEGRKFGLGLMVISQRPARIDKNVLSQCHTQIILRITNANDLRALTKGLEGISTELEEEIKRLPPGVALLVSDDIERPISVDIRVRRSAHGGESISILDEEDSEEAHESLITSIFRRSERD